MAEATAAVATAENKAPHPMIVFRDQVNARLAEFKLALPATMPPERFCRSLVTAVQFNPQLLACDQRSLWNAAMRAAQDGVLPDGRQGAIVPFRDNAPKSLTSGKLVAQWLLMKDGMLTRFRNSGQFKQVMTAVVRDGEEFDHWIDESGEHIKHKPGDNSDPKKIARAYAIGWTKDGGVMMKVMSRSEIEERRKVSKAPNGPMWGSWYPEAAQKTVLRALLKMLPQSSDDLERMVARDVETYGYNPLDDNTAERRAAIGQVTTAVEDFSMPIDGEAGSGIASPPTQPEPPEENILIARERGKAARSDGLERKAMPPEYREKGREAEANAWYEGFDQK